MDVIEETTTPAKAGPGTPPPPPGPTATSNTDSEVQQLRAEILRLTKLQAEQAQQTQAQLDLMTSFMTRQMSLNVGTMYVPKRLIQEGLY